MTITTTFALSGMLLFMLSVLVMDACREIRQTARGIADSLDHDTKIFPDYKP